MIKVTSSPSEPDDDEYDGVDEEGFIIEFDEGPDIKVVFDREMSILRLELEKVDPEERIDCSSIFTPTVRGVCCDVRYLNDGRQKLVAVEIQL